MRPHKFNNDNILRTASISKGTANLNDQIFLYDSRDGKDYLSMLYKERQKYFLREPLDIFVLIGEIHVTINRCEHILNANTCLTIGSDSTFCINSISPDTQYLFIRTSNETRQRCQMDLGLYNDIINTTQRHALAHLSADEFAYAVSLFDELKKGLRQKNFNMRDIFTRGYINLMYIHAVNICQLYVKPRGNATSKQENIYRQFVDLLNEYAKCEREVQFYADKLGITPKYLSSISLAYCNKNASTKISEYVTTLAINMMHEKNMKISEISKELNFSSQSFFGRFFKRTVGISPKQYQLKEL